jgi:hypothetical protein
LQINLLKIDAEGWDGWILQNGTKNLLQQNLIQAFVFEYHGRAGGVGVYYHGRLEDFVTKFWTWGYTCFHITCPFLFPLTPPGMWQEDYEYYSQGNVLCLLPGELLMRTYENFYGNPGIKGALPIYQATLSCLRKIRVCVFNT